MALNVREWNIGAHTQFGGTIFSTVETGLNYGMYTTQFFMGNPKSYNRKKISEKDIDETKKLLESYPMHIFTHFPYISNLAGSKDILGWNGNKIIDGKLEHLISELSYELSVLSNFENNGVVIHPGNHKNRKDGIRAISKSINRIKFEENSTLLLENSSGGGTSLATTFDELHDILAGITDEKRKHVKVCLDTCHIFAFGTYSFSDTKNIDKLFTDFDKKIGLDFLSLIHLNDSERNQGSKIDRHACLGTGHIWNTDFSSLRYLMEKCKKHGIPSVLETHGSDMSVIMKVQYLK